MTRRFAPQMHVWVGDKLPWVSISDGLPQFAAGSAGPVPRRERCPSARARQQRRVTIASSAVGSHASITGLRSNTTVPLSISRCSRKKPMPIIRPSIMRVPAPAERSEPSTNGIAEQHGERDRHGARDARPEGEHVLARVQRVGSADTGSAATGRGW